MDPQLASATGELTDCLRLWRDGDPQAFERLIPLVYDDLHRMAMRRLAGDRANLSWQATALVNEVCMRLLGWDGARLQNRTHFFAVSAEMMRHVLVDIARRRHAARRGGPDAQRVSLDDLDVEAPQPDADLVALDEALNRLAVDDPRKARVVELRFFGGLSMDRSGSATVARSSTLTRAGGSARSPCSRQATRSCWARRSLYRCRRLVSAMRAPSTTSARRVVSISWSRQVPPAPTEIRVILGWQRLLESAGGRTASR